MRVKQDRILVTGGAGFIGSAIIWELNSMGIDGITVCDRLDSSEKVRNLYPLKIDNYVDADELLGYLGTKEGKQIKTIFHLGACSDTMETDARYIMANNFEFTKKLANHAAENKIRFIYASSAATYGLGDKGREFSDKGEIKELMPLNTYALSKQLFDVYAKKNKLPVYGLKYFNIFGPNEYHKGRMKSLVAQWAQQLEETGKMKLFKNHGNSDKDQARDFLYIKDAVKMTVFFANIEEEKEKKSNYGVYNIGSGKAYPFTELARIIFEVKGRPENIEYIEMPVRLLSAYQFYTCADISKLRALGYKEKITPLKDAVVDYITHYLGDSRSNPVRLGCEVGY